RGDGRVKLWRQGSRSVGWWAAAALGVALLVLDLRGDIQHGAVDWKTVFFTATMTIGMAVGLWVWAWRPQTHMGPLMYWWPALFVAGDLGVAYPMSRTATTVGLALFTMGPIVYAQMTLAYPNGKLEGRLTWFYILVLAYAAQVIQNLYNLLFY